MYDECVIIKVKNPIRAHSSILIYEFQCRNVKNLDKKCKVNEKKKSKISTISKLKKLKKKRDKIKKKYIYIYIYIYI